MNQPLEDQLKQLEQATSTDSSQVDQLDDETTSLRESWLMLGRLIDAADAESETLTPAMQTQPRPAHSWRIALAVAAMLLIAFVSWSFMRRQASSIPSPEIARQEEQGSDRADPGSEVASVGEENTVEPVESAATSAFAWDDAFEEELTKASVAIYSARSDWRNGEVSYSSLSDRFAEFEQELEEGSL